MTDQPVYNGWLKVYHREVQGKTYDVLKDYNAVAAIIVNDENELLLVKQFRPALMEEIFEIPAGSLDQPEESILECLVREVEEEAQLQLRKEDFQPVLTYQPNVGFSNSQMHLYVIKVKKQEKKSCRIFEDEIVEVVWMPVTEVEKKIQNGEIQDIKTILACWYLTGHRSL